MLVALCICHAIFSQETKDGKTEAKNEVKLNLLMTVLKIPEISYERILSNNLGLGLSAGFSFDNDALDINYQIIPYGRFYFGRKHGSGFFIEANAALVGFKEEYYVNYTYEYRTRDVTGFGVGFAIGGKFINNNDFIGEFFLGCGNTFSKNDYIYPRIGVSIGKQF